MALPRKVLLKKANKFELKELEKNPIPHAHLPDLDKLLNDVCLTQRPTPLGYYNRRDLIRIFNAIAKEIYVNEDVCPVVVGFGSFVMDLFNEGSDLDLSINFGNPAVELPREKKIQTLRTFAKKFYSLQRKGHVTSVQAIMSARVPIVKVIDHGTRIECDLSVENWDGILKSQLVHVISAIDERFQKLSFLMKAWAKANGINSSRDRTLNSLSIILLVAFHFQMRDPPILPPFSLLFKDGLEPENVKKNVDSFLNYGKANKESLALLFVTLLIKLASVEKLWQKGICASVYDGSWISKTWDSRCGTISVEDFTERNENVSRAVGTEEVKKIYDCIHRSIHGLTAFLEGKMPAPMLKELLFGSENVATVQNIDKKESVLSKSPTVNHHHQNKRMQLSANSGESHVTDSQFGSENVATIQNNDKKEDLLSKSPTDDHPHQNEKMQLSANSGESHAADRQTGMENVTSVQKDKKGRVLSKSPTVNHRHKNKKMRLSANSGVGWERTYPGNWGRNTQVNGWGWNGPAYGQTSQHVVPHLRQQPPDQRRVASTWDVKIAPSAWDRQSGLSNFHSVSSTWNGKTGPWNYNYVSSTWDDRIAPANFGSVSSTWGSKVTPPNSGSMASTWGSKIAAPNPSSAAPTWHSNRASLNIPPVASAWDSGIACPNYNPVATLVQAAVAGVHGSLLQQPWVSHHNSLGYDASQAPPNHSNALNWPNSRAPYSGRQAPY